MWNPFKKNPNKEILKKIKKCEEIDKKYEREKMEQIVITSQKMVSFMNMLNKQKIFFLRIIGMTIAIIGMMQDKNYQIEKL